MLRVIGVGGGGCNAVNRMIESNVQGVEFIAVNTDYQVLELSKAPVNLRIGDKATRGLGAGADPEKGQLAANESREDLAELIKGTDLLFITAGMGGGTGTGAAPVIASIARDMGILTVAVVTRPFGFEGATRRENANVGIQELESYVDSLIIVPNDKLLEIADEDMSIEDAFAYADQILKYGVAGITDLITVPGLVNLDLADIRRVMCNAGICHMGIGRANGESRASMAIDAAIHSPLLETSIDNASKVIINFTGASVKIQEINLATSMVRDVASPDADIIFGTVTDPQMGDDLMITVIASGFGGQPKAPEMIRPAVQPRESSVPSFLSQLRQETTRTQPRPAAPVTPPPAPAPQPTQPLHHTQPRLAYDPLTEDEPTAPARSTYTPLTSEPTNRREPNYHNYGQQPAPAPRGGRPTSEGGKKSGLLPWLFNENDDDE